MLEEAEFYNLPALIRLVKLRILEREEKESQRRINSVYRVLQCSEKELTQTVSSLSDGWRFEQVLAFTDDFVCSLT